MKRKLSCKEIGTVLHNHYHWVVAVTMILMLFVHGGAMNNITGLHIIPVTEDMGISRTDYSLAYSGKTVFGMLSTFLSGFFFSRFGARMTVTAGLLLSTAAFLLFANLQGVWTLVLAGCLLGASMGFCSTAGAANVTRTWFHKHVGTVFGMVTAATGVGGSVMCILQTAAMESGSYKTSFVLCACMVGALALLVVLLIRNHPKDKGLAPLGEGEEIIAKRKRGLVITTPGLPMKTLWTRPAFYLMLLFVLLICTCVYIPFPVMRPYLLDCGFDEGVASGMQSAMLLILTLTKVLAGFFTDLYGAKKVIFACVVAAVLGLLALTFIQSLPVAIPVMIVYTCCLPMVSVGVPLIAYELFGYRAQTQYTGIFLGMIIVTNFIAEFISNVMYEGFGSYRYAFYLAAAMAAVCLPLCLILYRLAAKDLKRPDAQ